MFAQLPCPRHAELPIRDKRGRDLATHRAEYSSTPPLPLTVRDVATADSLRCAPRTLASACDHAARQ